MGVACSYAPATNYPGCTDPGDALQLTDGVYNGCNWSDKGTVGWQVGHERVFLIDMDLGEERPIGKITLDSIAGSAQVTFPSAALAFVSSDGQKYHYLCDVISESLPQDKSLNYRFAADGLKGWGRYVRIAVLSGGFYIFCDEIEVMKGDHAADQAEYLDDAAIPADEVKAYAANLIPWVTQKNATLTLLREATEAVKAREGAVGDQAAIAAARAAIEDTRSGVLGHPDVQEPDYDQGPPYRVYDRRAFAAVAGLNRKLWPGKKAILWDRSDWAWLRVLEAPLDGQLGAKINVNMMNNEFATASFIVTSSSDTDQKVELDASPLTGPDTIPSDQIMTLAHVVHVEAFGYNYRDDAIVPEEEGPIVLGPGVSKRIWVTFKTRGKNLAPGFYTGDIAVSVGGESVGRVPVSLRVWPLRFPDQVSLNSNTWGSFDEQPLVGREEDAAQDLVDHYSTALTISHRYLPHPKPDAEGNLTGPLDFTKLDQMIAWNPQCRLWLIWAGFEFGFGDMGTGQFATPVWEKVFTEYVTQMRDHLAEKGIGTDQFAWYWVDEPDGKAWDELCVPASKLVKRIDQSMLTWENPTGGVSHQQLEDGLAYFDIYCPNDSHVSDGAALDILRRTSRKSWVYACGSEKNAPPFEYYRRFSWRAWQLGLGGVGMWVYADGNGMTLSDYTSGVSYGLVFRGKKGLIGSKRWDAWRQGIADYEYLRILNDAMDKAREAGTNADAVKHAEQILSVGVADVIGDSTHGGKPDQAGAPDEYRVEMLEVLAKLGTRR